MRLDRMVFAISGGLILMCIALSYLFTRHWLIVAAIVGMNMVQAAFTGWCPVAMTLRKLGVRSDSIFI